jgi:hypothetical protein
MSPIRRRGGIASIALVATLVATPAVARDVRAAPHDYRQKLAALEPGDTLRLIAGEYSSGLPIHGLTGTAAAPIRIIADDPRARPRFVARAGHNTISIVDSSHVAIESLDLDGRGLRVDAVKAEGHARYAHFVTLADLRIFGHSPDQQTVGISTKCPAFYWIVRGNRIEAIGTGMYFGDSDGGAPFVAGLIEDNDILDSTGYNLQIKHQRSREGLADLPVGRARTIVRRNFFAKSATSASGEAARPNVLVGHLPKSGAGVDDEYVLYANLFRDNATEALFQGEGNVALYSNVFLNRYGPGIVVMPHNDKPRVVRVFENTIVAAGPGIRMQGVESPVPPLVLGNLVFATPAIGGAAATGNVVAALGDLSGYFDDLRDDRAIRLVPRRPPRSDRKRAPLGLPDESRDFAGALRSGREVGAFAY